MKSILEKFSTWLKAQGVSKHTQRAYLTVIKEVTKKVKIKDFTEDTLTDFLLKLNEEKSFSTLTVYKAGLRAFNKFRKIDIIIPPIVKKTKTNETPIHFTEKEFRNEILPLVSKFQNPLKVEALFTFMFYTGLRRSEIANLKRKDINFEERSVKILGKGKKIRVVGFPKKIIPLLKIYFGSDPETKNAFNSSGSNIKRYCDKLTEFYGKIKITPHTFRHSYGCRKRLKGIDGDTLSKLMGHTDSRTTQIYTKLRDEEILARDRKIEEGE